MIQVTIILKSGASFEIFVKEFAVRRDWLGEIIALDWSGDEKELSRLQYINIKELAAITSKIVEVHSLG